MAAPHRLRLDPSPLHRGGGRRLLGLLLAVLVVAAAASWLGAMPPRGALGSGGRLALLALYVVVADRTWQRARDCIELQIAGPAARLAARLAVIATLALGTVAATLGLLLPD